jgi:hypothetical protein
MNPALIARMQAPGPKKLLALGKAVAKKVKPEHFPGFSRQGA